MAYTEVYDMLSDKMTEKDLDALLELVGENPDSGRYGSQMPSSTDYNHINMKVVNGPQDDTFNQSNIVNLWHAVWKSFRKVGFVTILDEFGDEQKITVSEDYMEIGNEVNIEWQWVTETWEGYRVGEDLYVGIWPCQYQHISMDNMNSQKLPYSGAIYNNANTESKSLVAIMKPLQYMYIIVWYRLELALARDKGKVITMDITQIPKSMNIDAAKWMHYLSAVGVNFVNPYEEGWDIPGREGGKPAQFNQISALDLTMAQVVDQYINLMSKIEDMISDISGVSRQRQGSVSSRELVGSIERSVTQSSLVTEPLFWMHNQCKKNAMKMLLNTAKEAWRESGRKNIQYVLNDSTRSFLTLSEDFFYEDYDIFVSNSVRDLQALEQIKTLYQPAMQNGATILDIAQILTLDNVTEIKSKLAEIEKKRMEQNENAADSENQRQAQLIEMQNKSKEQQVQLGQQKLELEKYKIDTDNQTRIYVAELNAYRGQQDLDADNNGIPDVMEIAEFSLKENELESKKMDAQMANYQKEKEIERKHSVEQKKIDSQSEIENKKISLEREKLSLEKEKLKSQKELQSMKDRAALAREQLKARTALKNKTVSGK